MGELLFSYLLSVIVRQALENESELLKCLTFRLWHEDGEEDDGKENNATIKEECPGRGDGLGNAKECESHNTTHKTVDNHT